MASESSDTEQDRSRQRMIGRGREIFFGRLKVKPKQGSSTRTPNSSADESSASPLGSVSHSTDGFSPVPSLIAEERLAQETSAAAETQEENKGEGLNTANSLHAAEECFSPTSTAAHRDASACEVSTQQMRETENGGTVVGQEDVRPPFLALLETFSRACTTHFL